MKISLPLLFLILLTGACAHLEKGPERVEIPTTPHPEPPPLVARALPYSGAIFASGHHRPLFENRRAGQLGDVLTINIVEKTSATKKSNSKVNRSGAVDSSISAMPFAQSSTLGRLGINGSSRQSFDGAGETGSDNDFSGQITVSVVQLLRNGNLVVRGEKQIGLNGNVDVLRFSGVVNPSSILPDNSVPSNLVADARLDFNGKGAIGESQSMGWLSRFFLNFLPI